MLVCLVLSCWRPSLEQLQLGARPMIGNVWIDYYCQHRTFAGGSTSDFRPSWLLPELLYSNRVVMSDGFVAWWEPYGLLTSQHHHYYWEVTALESRARTKTKMGRRHSSTPPLSGRFFWRSIYLRFPCHN